MTNILLLVLCCLVLNCIMAYLFHNSRYRNGEKCTLNLATWIVYGIITFIPIVNVFFTIVCIVYLSISYSERDYIIQEDSWLGKRY